MLFLDSILSWASFGIICLVSATSVWLFGAWEMWYFWPFVAAISVSTALFGFRTLLLGHIPNGAPAFPYHHDDKIPLVRRNRLLMLFAAFLVYALVRMFQADVYMDAERSFLLFATAFVIGVQVAFGFSEKQRRLMFYLLCINILLIGLYGIINHLVWGNKNVLWLAGEKQYQQGGHARATGSYFCPDHFAGLLELGLCLCLGLLLDRSTNRGWKTFAVILSAVAVTGIILSKSRGAVITVAVLAVAVLAWGFKSWPAIRRLKIRLWVSAIMLAGLTILFLTPNPYSKRFISYFTVDTKNAGSAAEIAHLVKNKFLGSTRGRMYSGAYRAWKSEPVFGIGPGMHQHLWPHFAPSPDGNRELGVWPTWPNENFRSFEVHSDWLQLLEEYGLVGFLLACAVFFYSLHILRITMASSTTFLDTDRGSISSETLLPAAFFSLITMGFHSLGDFNLQIPATTWMLSVIVALGLHAAVALPIPEHEL